MILLLMLTNVCIIYTALDIEPLDTWDEEETILTPDGDGDDEVSINKCN